MTASLLPLLKTQTAAHHARTEHNFFITEIENATLAPEQYKIMLQVQHDYHAALLKEIETRDELHELYTQPLTEKLTQMKNDLSKLNVTIDSPKPHFDSWDNDALVGALYVGLGSMLGGSVIHKLLQRNKKLVETAAPFHYFQHCSLEAGNVWRMFTEHANTIQEGRHQAVLEGAKSGFNLFADVTNTYKTMQEENKKRVLVIDDERDVTNMIERLLKKEYELCIKNDGNDVIKAIEDCQPDIVVVDGLVHQRSCATIIREIQKDDRFSNIPILVYSAFDQLEERIERLNVVGFINKDRGLKALQTELHKILN